MTLRLILIRHAKSSWDDPLLDDHARRLNPRGQDAARRIGRWLEAAGYRPDAALVSSATRTRETWALLAQELAAPPEPRFLDALYHAPPELMLRALRAAPAEARTVAMVGHNPGIAEFAAQIVSARPIHPAFARYPTAATLVADFAAASWQEVRPGTGTVVNFVVPRELEPPAVAPGASQLG